MRRDYAWGWCTKDGVQKESMQKCTVYLLGIFKTTGGVLKDDGQDLDGGKQMTQPDYLKKVFSVFHGAYVNGQNELIISEKGNVYFCLDDVNSYDDFLGKVFAWCSRSACKGMPYHSERYNRKFREEIRGGLNRIIDRDFSEEGWSLIYGLLGNGINRTLMTKFIGSGLDLRVLEANI